MNSTCINPQLVQELQQYLDGMDGDDGGDGDAAVYEMEINALASQICLG